MYFCPCSCSKPDGENEEDVLIYLPRNLSYAGESYLDRYSVSSAFVHNGKLEKQMLQTDVTEQYIRAGANACAELLQIEREETDKDDSESEQLLGARAMTDRDPSTCNEDCSRTPFRGGPDNCDASVSVETTMSLPASSPSVSVPIPTPSSFLPPLTVHAGRDNSSAGQSDPFSRYLIKMESPDSDLVSEEGVFVNMMDDLDGIEGAVGKSTLSEASDDTYVSGDSMYYSPEDVEEMDDEEARGELKVSLEAAVQHAAHSLQPLCRDVPKDTSCDSQDNDTASCDTVTESELPDSRDDVQDVPSESQNGHVGVQDAPPELQNTQADVQDIPSTSQDAQPDSPKCESESKDKDCGSQDASKSESKDSVSEAKNVSSKTTDFDLSKAASGLKITVNDKPAVFPPLDGRGHLSSSYLELMSPESPLYEDREFNFTRSELRKSASLKSTKTPPGTPRRKKVVRFADAMGLDLESVRHILNLESPPKIPPSAMKDLQTGLGEDRKGLGTKFIAETFPQPGADIHFRDRVLTEKVVLENALIVSGSITGVVRVANIGFHKAVRVRFTTNNWATFHDIAASYMVNSCDGGTDRFSFTVVPPADFVPGSKLEFAISFTVNGGDFWDNNKGKNYVFECYNKTVPTESENAWMHFL